MYVHKTAKLLRQRYIQTGNFAFLRAEAALLEKPVTRRGNWIDDRPHLFRMACIIHTEKIRAWPAAMQVAREIGGVTKEIIEANAKRIDGKYRLERKKYEREFKEKGNIYLDMAPHAGNIGTPFEYFLSTKPGPFNRKTPGSKI